MNNIILVKYNEKSHIFEINNKKIKYIINKWKINSNKFNKYIMFENLNDYKGNIIFRDYRMIEIPFKNKKEFIFMEYVIWANNINIDRLRESKHWLIDCTFRYTNGFKELMVIEYKDIITKEKIPDMFILLNNKTEELYTLCLESAANIITQYGIYDLNLESITTDTEFALMNACNRIFPNVLRIGCLFYFKQDLLSNMRKYGLYCFFFKITSNIILNE